MLIQTDYLESRPARLRAFTGAVKKEFILLTRYPVSLACGMGQVIVIMAVFILAVPLFSGSSGTGNGVSVSNAMTWGFVMFMLFNAAMWEIGTSLRNEQVQGTLESLYLTSTIPHSTITHTTTSVCTLKVIIVMLFT